MAQSVTNGPNAEEILSGVFEALHRVQVQDRPVPTSHIQALLMVARERGGLTMTQVVKALDVDPSGAKRILDALSAEGRGTAGQPGLGLIEGIDDPKSKQRKLFFLTRKGAERVNQMLEALTGQRLAFKPDNAKDFLAQHKR